MLRKSILFLSVLSFSAISLAVDFPKSLEEKLSTGKALVKVGEKEIHEGYLDFIKSVEPRLKMQLDNPQGKKMIVNGLIEQELFHREAVKRKIDQDPAFQEKLALYTQRLMAMALLEDEIKRKALEYYNENKEKDFEQVKVAHLFFSSVVKPKAPETGAASRPAASTQPSEADRKAQEEQAKKDAESRALDAHKRLKSGNAWDELAKTSSDDKATANRAGEWGVFTRSDSRATTLEYQKIIDAVFSLKAGEYSEPIPAKDGWHIVKVLEEKKTVSFDEAFNALQFRLRGEVQKTLFDTLKKETKVEYLDTSLVESAPESGPTGRPNLPPGMIVPPQRR